MINRLHLSSFIGLTITTWLVALWVMGEPVLSWQFMKPFSVVVAVISVILLVFNKWAWSWKLFSGWFVNRPDLRGTWLAELQTSWIHPDTQMTAPNFVAYVVIRQSLTQLSLRLITEDSRSKAIAYSLTREEDNQFRLAVVYLNEPKIELQGASSEIHHGSLLLEIHGHAASEMTGHYWTDRKTRGSMKLSQRTAVYLDSFEQGQALYSNRGE